MTPLSSTKPETRVPIGKLCVGGDWACAHGDLGGLRYVAQQLADYVREPMHGELDTLVAACANDPDRAIALWTSLKDRVCRRARATGSR
jgi:hypothetical protein